MAPSFIEEAEVWKNSEQSKMFSLFYLQGNNYVTLNFASDEWRRLTRPLWKLSSKPFFKLLLHFKTHLIMGGERLQRGIDIANA